ncbi:hypothetical protein HIM_10479 [Hirsutella minnesotensis 3608]|uniref:Uncharacterized protein n=1 Tax=Hirsutella minnesotensis 3608 TaxID=1043627 RepID=A0A0F7ZRS8_9HYPO|nr:hypothetical protein HIM_10479 [Hirsutella minnesotensis 3608]
MRQGQYAPGFRRRLDSADTQVMDSVTGRVASGHLGDRYGLLNAITALSSFCILAAWIPFSNMNSATAFVLVHGFLWGGSLWMMLGLVVQEASHTQTGLRVGDTVHKKERRVQGRDGAGEEGRATGGDGGRQGLPRRQGLVEPARERKGHRIRRDDRASRAAGQRAGMRAVPQQGGHGRGQGDEVAGAVGGRDVGGGDERARAGGGRAGRAVGGARRDAEADEGLRTGERTGGTRRGPRRGGGRLRAGGGEARPRVRVRGLGGGSERVRRREVVSAGGIGPGDGWLGRKVGMRRRGGRMRRLRDETMDGDDRGRDGHQGGGGRDAGWDGDGFAAKEATAVRAMVGAGQGNAGGRGGGRVPGPGGRLGKRMRVLPDVGSGRARARVRGMSTAGRRGMEGDAEQEGRHAKGAIREEAVGVVLGMFRLRVAASDMSGVEGNRRGRGTVHEGAGGRMPARTVVGGRVRSGMDEMARGGGVVVVGDDGTGRARGVGSRWRVISMVGGAGEMGRTGDEPALPGGRWIMGVSRRIRGRRAV